MNSGTALITVAPFRGTTSLDKNGKAPVFLVIKAGKIPNRQTLSGTVAENKGLQMGKTYVISYRETGDDDEFGPQYNIDIDMEVSTVTDLLTAKKELGDPVVFTVEKPVNGDYKRKSNVVTGQNKLRQTEGKFHPSIVAATSLTPVAETKKRDLAIS